MKFTANLKSVMFLCRGGCSGVDVPENRLSSPVLLSLGQNFPEFQTTTSYTTTQKSSLNRSKIVVVPYGYCGISVEYYTHASFVALYV